MTDTKISEFEAFLESEMENGNIDTAQEYGERGYTLEDDKRSILLADWNPYDKDFMEWIEENFEIEWSDEWIQDWDNDGKIYRCVGDSYSWEQAFRMTDNGELITPDSDIEDWIDHCEMTYEDHPQAKAKALPSFIDFDHEDLGYIEVDEDFENGWYDRQDDPNTIAQSLFEDHNATSVIFQLGGVGQFSVGFTAYFKAEVNE